MTTLRERIEAIETLDYYDDSGSNDFNVDRYREDVIRLVEAPEKPKPCGCGHPEDNHYTTTGCLRCERYMQDHDRWDV